MKISDVRIRMVKSESSKIKASASITIDECFVVHDIKVIYARERFFIVMPSRKNPDDTYRDIVHPINAHFRTELEEAVIDAYHVQLANAEIEAGEQSDAVIL